MFPSGLGDRSSILVRVIPKTKKMVLDTSLFKTELFSYVASVKLNDPKKSVTFNATPLYKSKVGFFWIATTLKFRRGCYSIPCIARLYPWSLPYNPEWLRKAASSTIFFWIDPGLPDIVEHSTHSGRPRRRSPTSHLGVVAIEKIAFRFPSITVANFIFMYMYECNLFSFPWVNLEIWIFIFLTLVYTCFWVHSRLLGG